MIKGKGYLKVATVAGVPIELHWSFPVGGFLVCWAGDIDLRNCGYYCLAYTLLILIHEAGHAFVARTLGLHVTRIQIRSTGGLCLVERPPHVWQSVLVWSAGLMAQLVTFLLTWGYVAVLGTPQSLTGQALANTFIYVNIVIFVLCLIPSHTKDGLASDGRVLWDLYRHAYHGQTHPHPQIPIAAADESPVFPRDLRLLSMAQFRTSEFKQGIEILNDQTTSMEFVLDVLSRHVPLNDEQAFQKMVEIHNKGGVLIPLPTREKARSVADAITANVLAAGHSLVCRYAEVEEEMGEVNEAR